MPDNHPRTQLCSMIQQYSQSIIDDPKRCKSMLSDLAPQHRLEINLLITALEQKIAQELLSPSVLIPINLQLEQLTQHLQDTVGIQEELAYWAVESWALALNVIQQPLPRASISPKVTSSKSIQQRIGKFIVQDGVATDVEKTGLMWCRFAYGQSWQHDTALGFVESVSWYTAVGVKKNILERLLMPNTPTPIGVAEKFNQQGGYAGYTNWRLPTIDELLSLLDTIKGNQDNFIDADVFPNNNNCFNRFWSSSTCDSYALEVNFKNSYYSQYGNFEKSNYSKRGQTAEKGNNLGVRLVRSGQ